MNPTTNDSEHYLREELDNIGTYRPADMGSRMDAFLRDHPTCVFCDEPSATVVVGAEDEAGGYAVMAACETHAERART